MRERIISDPAILSGTPVFRGTRIPLDHVAGLLRKGVSAAELAEDYPALSPEDIALARVHAQLESSAAESSQIKPIQLRRKSRAA
jgi:uncharacterized protein (DUF433 family)